LETPQRENQEGNQQEYKYELPKENEETQPTHGRVGKLL